MSDYISVSRESLQKDQEKIKELEEKLRIAENKVVPPISSAHYRLHSMGQISLERELEDKNRYIDYLEDKVNFHEGTRPSINEVKDNSDDRILYNVKVAMERDTLHLSTNLRFEGVTEGGEAKGFALKINDNTLHDGFMPIPGIILGLPE